MLGLNLIFVSERATDGLIVWVAASKPIKLSWNVTMIDKNYSFARKLSLSRF